MNQAIGTTSDQHEPAQLISKQPLPIKYLQTAGATSGQIPTFDGTTVVWQSPSGSGIGGTIGPGQVAFGDFMVPNSILGSDDLSWNGSSLFVGNSRFSIQASNGTTQMTTSGGFVGMTGLSNPFITPSFTFSDSGRTIQAMVSDGSGTNNRRAWSFVSSSNTALYFDNFDASPSNHRFITVDSEAVKIGSYEDAGTHRNSNSSWGELSCGMTYGADGIATRGMLANATGAFFTTLDIFPFVPLLGIDVATKKAVTNYGERHKVRTIAEDADATAFDSDFIVAMRPVNVAVSYTLPATPANGDQYIVKDATGTAATNNITIDGNGNNIEATSTKVINTNYGCIHLSFNEVLSVWLVIS